MADNQVVQIGNGYFNIQKGTYTSYDPATGQLTTKAFNGDARKLNDPAYRQSVIERLQSGQLDVNRWFVYSPGQSGGRNNVNISGQVGMAFNAIMQKYPQMSKESAAQYANQWVSDRIAAGWDSNEVENMMKDVSRNPNSVNGDFIAGVEGMINQDEYKSLGNTTTGADLGVGAKDPRGSIQDELRAFAGRMMSVLPPDHPQVKRISELAAQAGNKYATQSGMGPGGLTATGVGGVTARALVDQQTQREGIGAQALAAAGNQQLSVDQLNTQLQQSNQQAGVMQGSNIGGLIGTGVGTVGGIVAAAYGAPQALPGLVAAGGAGGQAIGGTIANQGQPPISYGGGGGIGGAPAPRSSYGGRNWGGGTS